jgi:hypothetical protein
MKMIKGKIVKEFFLSTSEREVAAPKKQGKVGAEFNVVAVSNNYIIVNFKGDDVNYYIFEDEFKNIEFFKTKN